VGGGNRHLFGFRRGIRPRFARHRNRPHYWRTLDVTAARHVHLWRGLGPSGGWGHPATRLAAAGTSPALVKFLQDIPLGAMVALGLGSLDADGLRQLVTVANAG